MTADSLGDPPPDGGPCSTRGIRSAGRATPAAVDKREGGGKRMKLAKRLLVAVGSLLTLVLAGGAHIRF
jgi:hypothetical protein